MSFVPALKRKLFFDPFIGEYEKIQQKSYKFPSETSAAAMKKNGKDLGLVHWTNLRMLRSMFIDGLYS